MDSTVDTSKRKKNSSIMRRRGVLATSLESTEDPYVHMLYQSVVKQ